MKKKIFALAVIAICLSILASASMAYYVSEGTAHNVITSSGVSIAVEEWQAENDQYVPYPEEKIKIMPGAEVSKVVTLRNLQAESYVRAAYEIVMVNEAGEELDFDENLVTVIMGSEKWQKKTGDDYYWYYTDELSVNDATEPFITRVVFDGPSMTNEYQGAGIEVKILAEAVQAANNGDSGLEAEGWPVPAEE